MKRTLIQEDSSAFVKGLLERIITLSSLDHKLTKGELRELFISKLLKKFLTIQYDIGTGIIINQRGDQSNQTDIVIYDNRILPPFIKEQNIGIYPAESVLAAIEVKSNLRKRDILNANKSAKKLHEEVYNQDGFIYSKYPLLEYKPLCGIIGFYGSGCKELSKIESGKNWLMNNIQYLYILCLTEKYSWAKVGTKSSPWNFKRFDKNTFEETKRFVAILLDNIRTISEERYQLLLKKKHRDWLGIYIRDQNLFKTKKGD